MLGVTEAVAVVAVEGDYEVAEEEEEVLGTRREEAEEEAGWDTQATSEVVAVGNRYKISTSNNKNFDDPSTDGTNMWSLQYLLRQQMMLGNASTSDKNQIVMDFHIYVYTSYTFESWK